MRNAFYWRKMTIFPKRYFLWVCMSSFGGCMWDVNDVTVWPGSSTSPPSDPRRETVWYGLAAKKLAAKKLAANSLLRVFRRSDFIYTKNSAIGRSDFIYTKNSARLRYDCIYTKSFLRKSRNINDIVKNFPRCARQVEYFLSRNETAFAGVQNFRMSQNGITF